jgi:hypothetical protein
VESIRRRLILAGVAALVLAGGLGLRSVFTPRRDVVSIAASPTYQDPRLLERARHLPAATKYDGPWLSQTNPSACGPTSLANVARSLGDATASADLAAGAAGCRFGICFGGLTLDELARGAEVLTRRKVTVQRDLTLPQFRAELRRSNDPALRYVLNFSRGPLFGVGGGHHSPIGGYLEAEDLVFVLDVNAHYGPWLVPSERLFEAMDTVDSSSGRKRGLLRLE